jgi:RNA polymerase sigma-70 factor (ECF subfamily)
MAMKVRVRGMGDLRGIVGVRVKRLPAAGAGRHGYYIDFSCFSRRIFPRSGNNQTQAVADDLRGSCMPAEDERSLHRAVLAGDERAWRTWYDASFAAVDAYVIWRCAGLGDLADDVVQETWLRAVRRIRDFDPERGRFIAWLRGIAANVLRSQLRRPRPHKCVGENHAAPSESGLERREQAEQIARALARLSERHEAVLRMKYLEGLSVAVIAETWSETTKAVESLLSRARQALRAAYLEQQGPLLHEAEP